MTGFEGERVWTWFLENERRMRRYNSSTPQAFQGVWRTARIAICRAYPTPPPRTFRAFDSNDYRRRCEEWFSRGYVPPPEERKAIRHHLARIAPTLAEQLALPNPRAAAWEEIGQTVDQQAVLFDWKKVPHDHTGYREMPVRFFRTQLRHLLDQATQLDTLVLHARATIHEAFDVLHLAGADQIHGWHAGKWFPVDNWAEADAASVRANDIHLCCRLPRSDRPLHIAAWYGTSRFPTVATLPAGPLPIAAT